MKFTFSRDSLETVKADLIVVLCQQKVKDKDDKGIAILQKADGGIALDKHLGGLLSKIIIDETFRGETATSKLIYTSGKTTAKAVLLVGLGKTKEFTPEVLRKVGARITSVANEVKARSVAGIIQNESVKGFAPSTRIEALVEGFILGGYKFEQYKDKKDIEPATFKDAIFCQQGGRPARLLEEAINKGTTIANAIKFVRDMVNTPSKDMTPQILSAKAKEIATEAHLSCEVWDLKKIKEEKMGLFLAVARGSENEPKFVHISYKPKGKPRSKIALVGKGVTFDTGGYDLKPGRHMLAMKCDMAGAATCIALMKIIAELKPSVEVDAYMPMTDNMIDAKAEVPGNIVTARNGKTVEIISTDAEGRLILADALSVAAEKKPDYIIDMATLTGGVLYALGEIYTAVLGNDQKLVDKYIKAAKEESEPAWQLPLASEYKKGLTEGIADLKNLGKTRADTIVGGLFLQEFVGETKWMHLDIAESAWTEEERDYTPRGGTGTIVRTLTRLITSM